MGLEIDRETIRRVAKIGRLELRPEEEEQLLSDFKEILSAFSMLDEAKTDCDPAFHAIEILDYLREDDPHIDINPDEILEKMDLQQRYIRGPRMQ